MGRPAPQPRRRQNTRVRARLPTGQALLAFGEAAPEARRQTHLQRRMRTLQIQSENKWRDLITFFVLGRWKLAWTQLWAIGWGGLGRGVQNILGLFLLNLLLEICRSSYEPLHHLETKLYFKEFHSSNILHVAFNAPGALHLIFSHSCPTD